MSGPSPRGLLAALRGASGLTQEQLAERAGLSVRVVGKLENGVIARPRHRTLTALGEALALGDDDMNALFVSFDLRPSTLLERRAASPPTSTPPRQLPGRPIAFHGRLREHDVLVRHLLSPVAAGPAVVSGFGGIGKSGLVLQCAADVAEGFSDGQLFVKLTDPDGTARAPETVLAEFLRALGVAGRDLPNELAERTAMWRTVTAGRRLLILLDDAQFEGQVRPLLVGGSCRVVVTSRGTMGGLDAQLRIRLSPLTGAAATQVLHALAPAEMASLDEATTASVVAICAGVPLALRLLGARMVLSSGGAARELVRSAQPMALIRCGDESISLSIESTINRLHPLARRTLTQFAQLDLPVVTDWLAAAATGVPLSEAATVVDELADAGLLDAAESVVRRGYRLHDLVRAEARKQPVAVDDDDVARVASWMVHLLAATVPLAVARPVPHALWPERPVGLNDAVGAISDSAMKDWFEAELANALALTSVARKRGLSDIAAAIVAALRQPTTRAGRLDALREVAQHCADADPPHSLAWACNTLTVATVDAELGHWERACVAVCAVLPDLVAADSCTLAGAWQELGWLQTRLGRPRLAVPAFQNAIRLHRSINNTYGEISSSLGLAEVYAKLGDPRAADLAAQAASKARELGDRRVQIQAELALSSVDPSVGGIRLQSALQMAYESDEHSLAAQCHTALASLIGTSRRTRLLHARRAVALVRDLARPAELADALMQLGVGYDESGDRTAATRCWREARQIELDLNQRDSPRGLPDLLKNSGCRTYA